MLLRCCSTRTANIYLVQTRSFRITAGAKHYAKREDLHTTLCRARKGTGGHKHTALLLLLNYATCLRRIKFSSPSPPAKGQVHFGRAKCKFTIAICGSKEVLPFAKGQNPPAQRSRRRTGAGQWYGVQTFSRNV